MVRKRRPGADRINREEYTVMDINQRLTEELGVKRWQIDAAVKLIDEGNTIPFISRYRKEVTGSLNDEQLRKLHERLVYLRNLEEKKEQVIASIEEQGKMTEELKRQILAAETQVAVDDLYRPYRPKRRTRATIAKEKGLEPLAALITLQKTREPLENAAKDYISEEKGVETAGGRHCRCKGYHRGSHFRQCGLPELDPADNHEKGKSDFHRERPGSRVCL